MKLNFQSSSTSLTSVNGKIKDIRESEISSDGKRTKIKNDKSRKLLVFKLLEEIF